MKVQFALLGLMLFLTGCAAAGKDVSSTGTANAVVTVSHVYTGTEMEWLDDTKAQQKAVQKCQALGYSKAEAIAPQQQVCTRYTGYYSCFYHRVDQPYQCRDGS